MSLLISTSNYLASYGLLRCFSLDIEATKIAQLTGLNLNTVSKYLVLVRKIIAEECEIESPFSGDIEVDESFFGARRVKGKKGRGVSGKLSSSGCLNVTEKYTQESFLIASEQRYKW